MTRSKTIGLIAVAAALTASATVTAARLLTTACDPKQLVLRVSDVPRGFSIDGRQSRYWLNPAFTRGRPEFVKLVARTGRVTGYRRLFRQEVGSRVRHIASGAEVHQEARGATTYLSWIDEQQKQDNRMREKRGMPPYARIRARVGELGWMYIAGPPTDFVLVAWRSGRLVASIHSWGVGAGRTLDLARKQQRRIALATG